MAVSQAIQEEVLKEAYSATPNYDINYKDERFGKVESDKSQALTDLEATYGGMIGSTDKFYDDLKNQHQQWADKQAQIQQEQTDFTIEKIEQQKEQAEKDYIKEQSGAYVDWQKQSNQYGVNAEKMASAGLTGTGYSESSQVSMYNTYQNRVATAREVLAQAKLNYDNGIKEAMLQNSAALAEIYATNYIKQAELALEGFQYKNQLLLEQANKKIELDNMYYNRYQDVLQQINTENAMAEDIRQYNETMKWNTEQAELDRQFKSKEAELERQFKEAQAEIDRKHEKEMLAAKTKAEKEILEAQHKNDIAKLNQQLANEKALLQYQKSLNQSKITGSSGGSSKPAGYTGKTNMSKVTSNNTLKVTGTKPKSSNTTTNPTLNTKSKLSLGKGPISDAEAARQVNAGKATATIKNGQVYVTPTVVLPTSKFRR